MSALGDASYAIYLLHFLVAIPVVFMMRKYGLLGTPAVYTVAIALLAVVIALSLIVYRTFELPLRHALGPKRFTRVAATSLETRAA